MDFFSIVFPTLWESALLFQNEQMTRSLIQFEWYLLPIAEQMKFKFLVMHVDMGKTLTLGGIQPLNMVTCVTVILQFFSAFHREIQSISKRSCVS